VTFVDVMSGYLVCFTRRIVEVQGDPLHRSPSAVDLAPTPRCELTASIHHCYRRRHYRSCHYLHCQ